MKFLLTALFFLLLIFSPSQLTASPLQIHSQNSDLEREIARLEAQLRGDDAGAPPNRLELKEQLGQLYAQRPENRPSRNPLDQGADACTGTLISSLPYTDSGTTAGMADNYNTASSCGSSNSPDVIYRYVANTFGLVTVSLCGSGYDTVIEIRSGGSCPGTAQVACSDDNCGYQSEAQFQIVAGTTYYVIIEGFNSGSGAYTLNFSAPAPCDVQMQAGDILECTAESPDSVAMRSDCDGGCAVNPRLWGTIECGQTVFGHVFTFNNPLNGGNRRDNDAYHFTLTDSTNVTATVTGEVPLFVQIREGSCPADTLAATIAYPCEATSVTATALPPGTYTLSIASTVFANISTPKDYRATLICTPSGCDEPDFLIIKRATANGDSVQLNWIATQTTGSYRIYRTTQPNNDGNPNSGSDPQWTQIANLLAPTEPDTMTYFDGGLGGRVYSNYVVVHNCEPTARCCYNNNNSCGNLTQANCNSLAGTWTFGQTCSNPCPPPPPSYCTAFHSAGCSEFHITNVLFDDFDNPTGCTGSYHDYTNLFTPSLQNGQGYQIIVEFYTDGIYLPDAVVVWVDWNSDGDFTDAGERSNLHYGLDSYSGVFGPDPGTPTGPKRMRVRLGYGEFDAWDPDPCGDAGYGETEDYQVWVIN